ncbi:serine/threonine-protein kinase [Nonomuraea cypriaca]|uniref:serine/threonine-protein kinase n=1 Tax=Nonomuraea cypriaca TaxID=1187855 RepID=UPI001A9C4E7C|nr:serine/threonine-protein kinase [Nonomuraea cypriaca]
MEVPGYTELRELGHGGTGRVMLAVRDADGLSVAIKHLSPTLRADAEFVARFRAEAQVIREIDSPHTARLLEYVEAADDAVIVMELVDGVTLRRLLQHEGRTGPEAALAVLKGALLGLAEAHRRGVVHRDFKPENVMVTEEGDSKLVDFGVAAHTGETAELVGTPSYMAPEQWDDAPASPATDVYAATLVFFECLTGHRAFHGENVAALAYQHQNAPPPLENVDEPLRPLVEHGLAKDPIARPESAEAFLTELESVALDAYGEEWETRGRSGLGILLLPLAALLPRPQPVADGGTTSMFHSTLTPTGKLAVTGGLVVATAVAVVSTFVIFSDPPGSGAALPPAASSPPAAVVPASPTSGPPTSLTPIPTDSGTDTYTPEPTAPPTVGPGPVTREPTSGPPPVTREPTRQPTASQRPEPSTRPPTTAPPTSEPPATEPPDDEPPPAEEPPDTDPPDSDPPDDDPPATQPPTTSAPDPGAPPPAPPVNREPLLSISVGVSAGLPLLGGEGDGLLDAEVGVGLGSRLLDGELDLGVGLLGMVVVPGSVFLGRHIVARRVRRPRGSSPSWDLQKPDDLPDGDLPDGDLPGTDLPDADLADADRPDDLPDKKEKP